MRFLAPFTAVVLACSPLAPHCIADTLILPVGSQSKPALPLPKKGLSKQAVQSAYGTPSHTTAAVGTPPISRFEYPDFTVYFEYDHVIHAVAKHKPQQTAPIVEIKEEVVEP